MFELQIEIWLEASFWLSSYLSLQNSFFSYPAGMDKWKDVLYIFPWRNGWCVKTKVIYKCLRNTPIWLKREKDSRKCKVSVN